jgi:hypothetical protein
VYVTYSPDLDFFAIHSTTNSAKEEVKDHIASQCKKVVICLSVENKLPWLCLFHTRTLPNTKINKHKKCDNKCDSISVMLNIAIDSSLNVLCGKRK